MLQSEFDPWASPALTSRILFIGGLPVETTEKDLSQFLHIYSQIVWLQMGLDRQSNEFRGYAYTILADESAAEKLVLARGVVFKGVTVGVMRWRASCDYINQKDSWLKRKVFVKNLEYETSEPDLIKYFSRFGKVEIAEVRRDHLTKESRRIGYIQFFEETDAEKCLAVKKHYINRRRVEVKKCKSKQEQSNEARVDSDKTGKIKEAATKEGSFQPKFPAGRPISSKFNLSEGASKQEKCSKSFKNSVDKNTEEFPSMLSEQRDNLLTDYPSKESPGSDITLLLSQEAIPNDTPYNNSGIRSDTRINSNPFLNLRRDHKSTDFTPFSTQMNSTNTIVQRKPITIKYFACPNYY